MKTVTTKPKILTDVENVRFREYEDYLLNPEAEEHNLSIEEMQIVNFVERLQSALRNDLRDIWERLDELESKLRNAHDFSL